MEILIILIPAVVIWLWMRGKADNRKFLDAIRIGRVINNPGKLRALGATEVEIRRAEERQAIKDQKKVIRSAKAADRQFDMFCPPQAALKSNVLVANGKKYDITGADVVFENGEEVKRVTATRVVGGAVLLGPLGAVAGVLGKKDQSKVYVTATTREGAVAVVEFPKKKTGEARRLAGNISSAAAYFAQKELES